jgi:hypothetical protein
MGLRQKVLEFLSRGEPDPEPDEDEFVDLEVVPLHFGPLTVETLGAAGIEAVQFEEFDAPTAQSRAQIKVRRRQLAEATAVLDELR